MNNPDKNTLTERIARCLHELDPMNTCCSVNEGMADEYLSEAQEIAQLLGHGVPLKAAVKQTFDSRFWDGCLEEHTRAVGLHAVLTALASETSEGP